MKRLIIRHGKTPANRMTRAAFGNTGAPLSEEGIGQAQALGQVLAGRGIDVAATVVAVSPMIRTHETARHAGFTNLVPYDVLQEVQTNRPLDELTTLVQSGIIPPEALEAARAILADPPAEDIWVTHGLVIAALCEVLEHKPFEGVVPGYCEIVEVSI